MANADDNSDQGIETIDLNELPAPPAKIADLIKRGTVHLVVGNRGNDQESSPVSQVAAETRFDLKYHYRSSPRWKVETTPTGRSITITIQFHALDLDIKHEIWFRNRPSRDGFWADPLVRHEFDHVRLSSDPRLARRFAKLAHASRVLRTVVPDHQKVDAQWVRQQVDQHVAKLFEKISDLVVVRYRELDRLTQHGLKPVPQPFAQQYLSANQRNE